MVIEIFLLEWRVFNHDDDDDDIYSAWKLPCHDHHEENMRSCQPAHTHASTHTHTLYTHTHIHIIIHTHTHTHAHTHIHLHRRKRLIGSLALMRSAQWCGDRCKDSGFWVGA